MTVCTYFHLFGRTTLLFRIDLACKPGTLLQISFIGKCSRNRKNTRNPKTKRIKKTTQKKTATTTKKNNSKKLPHFLLIKPNIARVTAVLLVGEESTASRKAPHCRAQRTATDKTRTLPNGWRNEPPSSQTVPGCDAINVLKITPKG